MRRFQTIGLFEAGRTHPPCNEQISDELKYMFGKGCDFMTTLTNGAALAVADREGKLTVPEHAQLQSDLAVQPEVAIRDAQKAARTLIKVVQAKNDAVMIGGKQYLRFEDWQTIGRFYGVSVGIERTAQIEGGYEARAVVYKNGTVISAAEASCTSDEPNWSKRPDFMLRSMAQTRASAKALRNVLAWVAVIGGFEPTPAEEMDKTVPPATSNGTQKPKCPHCGTQGKYHAPDCPGA